jgi:hypothetical protein
MKRRKIPIITAAALAALALFAAGGAQADHVLVNVGGPQAIFADVPYPVNGSSGEWKWLANFPMGVGPEQPLGTDVETFVRNGKIHAIIGSMTLGFRLFRYEGFSLSSKPTPLGDYASAFPCNEVATSVLLNLVHSDEEEDVSDTLSIGGWQDDVAANANGTLAFIATDADGRCHDRDTAGAEIVDTSNLSRPRLFHLTGHFGESHTLTVDDRRGLIYINSSDTQANFMDIVDFRSCVPPATNPARFAACRPVVARYQFPVPHSAAVDSSFKDSRYPDGLTAGKSSTANNGCHDVTVQGNFLYCAAINATVIFDISGLMQRNIKTATRRGGSNCVSLTDMSCRLTGTHLTNQTMVNQDNSGPPHDACPVEDGDSLPYNLRPDSITNCEIWNRPTSDSQDSRYENDDFMMGKLRNANIRPVARIQHDGSKPSDQDISISHEADPTEDGTMLIVTDERGGGLTNLCDGTSKGGGGAWFYDIRDKSNPKLLKQPDGSNGVFISENAPVVGNCTIHVIQQVPGRNVIVAGWYIEGTHVFQFTPDLGAGRITFTELGHYIPGGGVLDPETWTSYPVGLEDGQLYIQTGDMTRGTDILAFNLGRAGCPSNDDEDADGLIDSRELLLFTLLGNPDSDLDGVKDGDDDANGNGQADEDEDDNDGCPDRDGDGDGVDDEDEDD